MKTFLTLIAASLFFLANFGCNENAVSPDEQAGIEFLEMNAKRAGVITTASGLQYEIVTEGAGPAPVLNDFVKVDYVGTLIDGTEFDSSFSRGEPATFPVSGVIAGWTEALLLMKVGSKYKLYIPPALGYGASGAGQLIGPNVVLIFEVELLEIL